MPNASANIIAKFNAQMLTGAIWVDSTRAPAADNKPTRVSINGSPAATRLPNAITSTIIVTGHDSTSDLIIAAWFTLLKFAHSALDPVRLTEIVGDERPVNGPARASAARTIALASALAPAWMMTVVPSLEMLTPGVGATTVPTRLSACSSAVARAMTCNPAGSEETGPARSWMTTCRAVEFGPAKSFAIRSRARTEELVLSCQPAPDKADSTCGANAPSTPRISSQPPSTTRRWLAAHAPRLASHPCIGCSDWAR